jgi:hypothetical protein
LIRVTEIDDTCLHEQLKVPFENSLGGVEVKIFVEVLGMSLVSVEVREKKELDSQPNITIRRKSLV